MALKKGFKVLVDEAMQEIETISAEEALKLQDDEDTTFVDIRDIRELERTGTVPGAVHAPRGMLEFWVDPESPYYRDVFGTGKRLVFFCAAAWRSALATKQMQDMGVPRVCHMDGGFGAWTEAGGPVEEKKRKD
jgi:rhodanese-related sulfurtransferase